MAMNAMNGIALSTQPFDRMSDKIRRGESTKRGTRWRGSRAKSIWADNVNVHRFATRGPGGTPRAKHLQN